MGGASAVGPKFGLALFLTLMPIGASAQTSAAVSNLEQKILELGRSLSPSIIAATAALYAPLQEQPPYQGVQVHRDLRYGPADRNRLDVFVPEPLPAEARPVLIFVHGGEFVNGDKTRPGSPFFDNIGVWAARHGLIGINITYRLAPKHPWPAAIEDIGAAVRWAIQNAAPYGGDPEKIFLMGHSAGATHVAGYVSHPDLQPPGGDIAGAILLSGIYDLTTMQIGPGEKAYFGDDPSVYAERSALAGLSETKIPLFVAISDFDLVEMEKQGNLLNKKACELKHCPRFLLLPKHNHMSEIYSINSNDDLLGNAILGFIKGN